MFLICGHSWAFPLVLITLELSPLGRGKGQGMLERCCRAHTGLCSFLCFSIHSNKIWLWPVSGLVTSEGWGKGFLRREGMCARGHFTRLWYIWGMRGFWGLGAFSCVSLWRPFWKAQLKIPGYLFGSMVIKISRKTKSQYPRLDATQQQWSSAGLAFCSLRVGTRGACRNLIYLSLGWPLTNWHGNGWTQGKEERAAKRTFCRLCSALQRDWKEALPAQCVSLMGWATSKVPLESLVLVSAAVMLSS